MWRKRKVSSSAGSQGGIRRRGTVSCSCQQPYRAVSCVSSEAWHEVETWGSRRETLRGASHVACMEAPPCRCRHRHAGACLSPLPVQHAIPERKLPQARVPLTLLATALLGVLGRHGAPAVPGCCSLRDSATMKPECFEEFETWGVCSYMEEAFNAAGWLRWAKLCTILQRISVEVWGLSLVAVLQVS